MASYTATYANGARVMLTNKNTVKGTVLETKIEGPTTGYTVKYLVMLDATDPGQPAVVPVDQSLLSAES